jgi:malic enzyme
MTQTHARTVLALGLLVLGLSGCGAAAASPVAACKAALMTDYAHAKATPAAPAASAPPACKGLSHAQLTNVIGQIISAQLPSPSPS